MKEYLFQKRDIFLNFTLWITVYSVFYNR